MIGGLYNTTSLLAEPTRAMGEIMRTANAGNAPLTAKQNEAAATARARTSEAEPVPDRLPTGIVEFVPVVVKMMETKAIEAIEADQAKTEPVREDGGGSGPEARAAEAGLEAAGAEAADTRASERAAPQAPRSEAAEGYAHASEGGSEGGEGHLNTRI